MGPRKAAGPAGQPRGVDFVWSSHERSGRGPKPGLSVEQITRAAIAIADTRGLDAVSMQRVAAEVGFATMALYRYVPGKRELIVLMADTVIGDPPALARIPGGWRPRLETWARQLLAVYQRHPWALHRPGPAGVFGPNELGWTEAAVAALAGTGLTGAEQVDAVLVLGAHVRGWTDYVMNCGDTASAPERWTPVTELAQRRRDRFPALLGALAPDAGVPGAGPEFGLRCILDGLGASIIRRSRDSEG